MLFGQRSISIEVSQIEVLRSLKDHAVAFGAGQSEERKSFCHSEGNTT